MNVATSVRNPPRATAELVWPILSRVPISIGGGEILKPAQKLSQVPRVPPPGTDPIRLGSGNIASFSALGTSSTGTVYIRSRRDAQYAVRIYGETGRTRMLKFEPRTGRWRQL